LKGVGLPRPTDFAGHHPRCPWWVFTDSPRFANQN
jgi:hypothetical protein